MKHLEQRLNELRSMRVQARRFLAGAHEIRDFIDRRVYVERWSEFLRGSQSEFEDLHNRLGLPDPTRQPIKLSYPPPQGSVPAVWPPTVMMRSVEVPARVKALAGGERAIEGWASTAETDRTGDRVIPAGCKYTTPLPILWAHRRDQPPIGKITTVKPSNKGVWVAGNIARIERPGRLRDLVDMAWDAVVAQLVTAFSIGFLPIKAEPIAGGKGLKFLEWELLETSLVGVPANAGCNITAAHGD